MCKDCGCEKALEKHGHKHSNDHEHSHSHDHHDHDHGHDHSHSHDHHHGHSHGHESPAKRLIHVTQNVLAHNEELAQRNREELKRWGVYTINIISSPGSGKTTLLERTLDALQGEIQCAVITGDQRTERDAERLRGRGAPVAQIETGNSCHLQAEQVSASFPEVLSCRPKLLLIENIGNLICPAAFDLGENEKVALLSVTEGEDKPIKYPVLFSTASLIVITKADLVPHLDWNRTENRKFIHEVAPHTPHIEVSSKSGLGMDDWLDYLRSKIVKKDLGQAVQNAAH